MRYKIFKDGAEINTIVASADFVKGYCERNGFTYETAEASTPVPLPGEITVSTKEMAAAILEGVNGI